MMQYPVTLTPDDNDTILVTFPDFPEAATFGDDRDEALVRAVDALETMIDAYIRDRQVIPAPSTGGDAVVTLPPLLAAKVQLYQEMRRQKVNKTALAQRMNVHLPQVDRLFDLKHGSTIEQLEAAALALGGRLDIVLIVPDNHPTAARGTTAVDVKAGGKFKIMRRKMGGQRQAGEVPLVHPGVLKQGKRSSRIAAAKKK